MRKIVYPLLVIAVVAGIYFAERWIDQRDRVSELSERHSVEKTSENSLFNEFYYPSSTTGIVVEHTYFTLSYNPKHGQSEWVAYKLHPLHLSDNSFKRPYFEIDAKVPGGSAHWKNYQNSGYDRGHLCPAGDRRFSYEAYKETFVTSNASPQNNGFNSGLWNRLEIQVRNWASKKGELFIITGAVLREDLPTIGVDRISVPKYFYKIIVTFDESTPKAIAFLMPNENRSEHISQFVTSISHLETLTGLQFFSKLPQTTEGALKGAVDYDFWNLRKK